MRFITTFALAAVLATPAMVQTAMAQTTMAPTTMAPTADGHTAAPRAMRHHAPAKHRGMGMQRQSEEDKGPFTPEANRAYNGGGAILEGAPGGPPPPASAVSSMPTTR